MPRTKDFANYVISVVADEMEVPSEAILSKCSTTEVVDARWIIVTILHKAGFYTMRIAESLKITPRYVQYIVTDFEDRIAVNRMLRNKYEIITNKLRKGLEITPL